MDVKLLQEVLAHPWVVWARDAPLKTQIGLGVGALAAVAMFIFLLQGLRVTWRTRHIPGPRSFPIIGHVPYLLKEPWIAFYNFYKQYGPQYKLYLFNKLFVVISDPDQVKQVFSTAGYKYPKDAWSYKFMEDVLGQGLVTAEGDMWAQQRQLLAPAFHLDALKKLESVFVQAADRLTDRIGDACAAPVNAVKAAHLDDAMTPMGGNACDAELGLTFRRVTLEVISEVALGLNPQQAGVFPSLFEAVLEELNERVFHPYRVLYPLVQWTYKKNLNRLNTIVQNIITERRAKCNVPVPTAEQAKPKKATIRATGSGDDKDDDTSGPAPPGKVDGGKIFAAGGDMLDMMLQSGVPLTDKQLSDELKTQLLAGHETSSMMLTWACYLLARHPAAMAKAVAEVDKVLGLHPGVTQTTVPDARVNEKPTFDDYKMLDYVEGSLNEAMRLFSPVPVLARESCEEDILGGNYIPAGTAIMVSVWSLHKSKQLWGDDVEEFKPERFARDGSRKPIKPFQFIPFSAGPRRCIGQNLAVVEAKVVLGNLLRKYTLTLKPGQAEPTTDRYIMPVRPAGGLHIIITPRK